MFLKGEIDLTCIMWNIIYKFSSQMNDSTVAYQITEITAWLNAKYQ